MRGAFSRFPVALSHGHTCDQAVLCAEGPHPEKLRDTASDRRGYPARRTYPEHVQEAPAASKAAGGGGGERSPGDETVQGVGSFAEPEEQSQSSIFFLLFLRAREGSEMILDPGRWRVYHLYGPWYILGFLFMLLYIYNVGVPFFLFTTAPIDVEISCALEKKCLIFAGAT